MNHVGRWREGGRGFRQNHRTGIDTLLSMGIENLDDAGPQFGNAHAGIGGSRQNLRMGRGVFEIGPCFGEPLFKLALFQLVYFVKTT